MIAVIIRFVLGEYEARIQNTEFVEFDLGTHLLKYCPVSNASYVLVGINSRKKIMYFHLQIRGSSRAG